MRAIEDCSRGISQAGALLPHLEALPQDEGEKAHEDMGLSAIFALMPDRTDVQLIFLDTESSLSLRELDIGLPELPIAPVGDVRAQEIGAFRERGPMIERGAVIDAEAEARRAAVWLQRNCEAGGGTLVLLQDAADLPVHRRRVEPLLRTSDASGQAFERRFNPPAELVMHGLFFAAPIGRAAQNHGLPRLGIMRELDLDAFLDRTPTVRGGEFRTESLQLRLRRADDIYSDSLKSR